MDKITPEQRELIDYVLDISEIEPTARTKSGNDETSSNNKLSVISKEANLTKVALLKSLGVATSDIAKRFGVQKADVVALFDTDGYRLAVQSLTQNILTQAKAVLSSKTFKAINALDDCLGSSDDRVKMQTAFGILDRLGLNKKMDINLKTKAVNSAFNPEDMGDIDEFINEKVQAMQEIKEMEEDYEDIEDYEEVNDDD